MDDAPPVRRIAAVIGIEDESKDEYLRLHADVWPDVIERLIRSNVTNYSIYLFGNLLFSYFEYGGTDFDADMAAMAADEPTRRWWEVTMPLQTTLREHESEAWWREIPEVFHLD